MIVDVAAELGLGANDIDQSKKFYDAVLGTIGVNAGFLAPDGRVFYMTPGGNFALTKPINGPEVKRTIGIIERRTARLSPAARQFRDMLVESWRS